MPRYKVLRSILVALVTVTLLAAPAAAAAPDRGGDEARRSGWTMTDLGGDLGDLLARVSELLFLDWVGEREETRDRGNETSRDIGRIGGANTANGQVDPNG